MSDDQRIRDDDPYARGAPDPTLLTRSESQGLEVRLRREMDEKLAALKELHETTFSLLKEQRDQMSTASKTAVDAALANQKEAATKIETSIGTQIKELDRRITESEKRLLTGEGMLRGSVDTRQERRSDIGSSMQVASTILSLVAILISLFLATRVLPNAPAVPVTIAPSPPAVLAPPR